MEMTKSVKVEKDTHSKLKSFAYENGMVLSDLVNAILNKAISVGLDNFVPDKIPVVGDDPVVNLSTDAGTHIEYDIYDDED